MSQLKTADISAQSKFVDIIRHIDRIYVLVAAIFLGIGVLAPDRLIPLAKLTLGNLAHTLMYMAFAVLLIAWLKATGAEAMVAGIFKGRENRMIVLAALVGGLAPFCSCEVIPFIAGLLALGTPLAPIMAFWLSSPLIDPPTLLITAAALGWKFAIAKAFFAVGLGLVGGFTIKFLTAGGHFSTPVKQEPVKKSPDLQDLMQPSIPMACCSEQPEKVDDEVMWKFWQQASRRNTFIKEFRENALFLLKWMLFAYTLESLMIEYIPAEKIASVVGGEGLLPIIISALVGVPAYLNSYIAPPVVSSLISQGMSIGSGMAFIVAGAISSIPAMTAVYALVRREVFVAYVVLGFSGAVASGVLYNIIA